MAQYGVVARNVVSMKAEPNAKSEQVSQAVMGETVQVKEQSGEFLLVETEDNYDGWVFSEFVYLCDDENGGAGNRWCVTVSTTPLRVTPEPFGDLVTQLVFLSRLEGREQEGAYWRVRYPTPQGVAEGYVSIADVEPQEINHTFDSERAVSIAKQWVGIPYLWGGSTPFGFDCSGFVQKIYQYFGVTLPRDAYLQPDSLEGVSLGKTILAGDLLYFGSESDPRNRGITHVGMALDSEHFIHASSRYGVAITPLSDTYYSRYLREVCRYSHSTQSIGDR